MSFTHVNFLLFIGIGLPKLYFDFEDESTHYPIPNDPRFTVQPVRQSGTENLAVSYTSGNKDNIKAAIVPSKRGIGKAVHLETEIHGDNYAASDECIHAIHCAGSFIQHDSCPMSMKIKYMTFYILGVTFTFWLKLESVGVGGGFTYNIVKTGNSATYDIDKKYQGFYVYLAGTSPYQMLIHVISRNGN